jgi:hypothetical protein
VEKVELPLDVYNAFENLKRTWGRLLKKEEMDVIFLNITHIAQVGDAVVLKKYALENATKYIQAVANGYELNSTDKLICQVDMMLNIWLEEPYEDEEKDRYNFAKDITEFIKSQLVTQ